MARDYARKSNTRSRKGSRSRSRKQKGAPGWIWLVAGLMVGLFIASLNYLNRDSKSHSLTTETKKPAPMVAQKKKTTQKHVKKSEASFDFYTTLTTGQANKLIEDKSSKPIERHHYRYTVNVASLKHFERADRLKAQLALQGYHTKIKSLVVKGNKWYRVTAGPFSELAKAEDFQTLLRQKQHIDSTITKTRED